MRREENQDAGSGPLNPGGPSLGHSPPTRHTSPSFLTGATFPPSQQLWVLPGAGSLSVSVIIVSQRPSDSGGLGCSLLFSQSQPSSQAKRGCPGRKRWRWHLNPGLYFKPNPPSSSPLHTHNTHRRQATLNMGELTFKDPCLLEHVEVRVPKISEMEGASDVTWTNNCPPWFLPSGSRGPWPPRL